MVKPELVERASFPGIIFAAAGAAGLSKPGGRLAVADMVALQPLPDDLKNNLTAYTGCLAGAELVSQLEIWLSEAGFERVQIKVRQKSSEFIQSDATQGKLDDYIASADVTAFKSIA